MRILLDTHTILWFLNGDVNLSPKAREMIISENNQVHVSIVSLWEMAIKVSLNKLSVEKGLRHIFSLIRENGFHILPLTEQHVLTVASLPFLHRDPFDRILIAQAEVENLPIITFDPEFSKYDVKILR